MRMMFFASRMAGTFVLLAAAVLSVIIAVHVARDGSGVLVNIVGPNWESTAGQALQTVAALLGLG